MQKSEFEEKAKSMGDFYLDYRKEGSNQTTYLVGTINFSTKYIANRMRKDVHVGDDEVLVWSWNSDKLRKIKLDRIKRLTPLSSVLRNRR